MPLGWAPKSLVDDTENWSFTNSANRAMTDLATMGERLMQPVTQQVRQVVEQAMPAPAPQPSPVPQPVVPSVPRFSLGKIEDWLTPAGPAQPAPELAQPAPPQMPAPAAETTQAPGMFSLPSLESFLGRPSPAAGPAGQTSAGPSGAPGPSGEVRIDRSSPTAFLGSFRPAAEAALSAKGYPTSLAPILAAIPMNEQGWQKDAPGNAYYGIKGSNPTTGANTGPVGTWEDYGAGRTNIQDTFRAYGSPTESVGDFLGFLESNPRYAQAVKIGKLTGDPAQFIRAVHAAGYATDPAWSDKVLSIARQVPERAATPPMATGGQQAPPTDGLDVRGLTEAYKGVPYTFGGPGGRGQGVGATTDCSGFVSAVWKNQYGLDLPAHTDAAYNQLKKLGGAEVDASQARPGDVVFYMGAGTGGAITHHMGVYAGPGTVLDMSVSGGSGVKERPIGHGGRYVIIRDPRLNASVPSSAAPPPPIVPTGLAEATGGRQVPQRTVNAASEQPRPLNPVARAVAPPPAVEIPTSSYNDPTAGGTISQPIAAPAVHDNVLSAFRSANGRDPDTSELAELASLGYGA